MAVACAVAVPLALAVTTVTPVPEAAESTALSAAKSCRKQITVQGRNYYRKRVTHLLNYRPRRPLLIEAPLDLPRVFDRACALSDAHVVRILSRSLDILHVAAALELECRLFVSADDRQLLLAAAVDLEVVDIKVRGRKAKR